MHQFLEAEVRSRPSALEFEMAYQARVAIDRIKFAIKHAEQFAKPCIHMGEVGLQLLDALERASKLWIGAFRFDLESLPTEMELYRMRKMSISSSTAKETRK